MSQTQSPELDSRDYISPGAAAKLLPVSVKTLSRMADDGTIRSIRLPKGHRRYLRADVLRLAEEHAA